GTNLPAVDLAAQRVVGLAEGEVGVEALVAASGLPDRNVELPEPLPDIEFARRPARGGEVVMAAVAARGALRHAAQTNLLGIHHAALHLDGPRVLIEGLLAVGEARREGQRAGAPAFV